jgi:hypothetical protein
MEKCTNLCIKLNCTPVELQCSSLTLLRDKYNDTIFKNLYIKEITSVEHKNGGRILNNGCIQYNVDVICNVINPCVDDTYNLRITHMNKMGALHKNELVTVFIPIQYFNNESPEVDSSFNIKIIGKRIEDSIVCVGKII